MSHRHSTAIVSTVISLKRVCGFTILSFLKISLVRIKASVDYISIYGKIHFVENVREKESSRLMLLCKHR